MVHNYYTYSREDRGDRMSLELIKDDDRKYHFNAKTEYKDTTVIEHDDKNKNPKFHLSRWEDECFIDIPIDLDDFDSFKEDANKLIWENAWVKILLYPKDEEIWKEEIAGEVREFKQDTLGGLEWEVVLKRQPSQNSFTVPIETQGLDFFYQEELHPDHPTYEEDGDGNVTSLRPSNVVGSYAVYHSEKGNVHPSQEEAEKYKTGKAFHIYRPHLIDDSGNETFADLKIDEKNGTLTITIDQAWLDNASYPVTIDPTFGYETAGGTSEWDWGYILGAYPFSPSEDGTVDSITIYESEHDETANRACAIYSEEDNSLVVESEATSVPVDPEWTTRDITGNYQNLDSSIDYNLAFWQDDSTHWYYDDNPNYAESDYYSGEWFNWPDPINWDDHPERDNIAISIYATYTTGPSVEENVKKRYYVKTGGN